MTDQQCPFCNPADIGPLSERFIYGNDKFGIIATKGQITDGGYVLLIPSEHVPCFGAVKEENAGDLFLLAETAATVLSTEYDSPVTIFEHGIVGQTIKHAHIHLLPAALKLKRKILADFPKAEIYKMEALRNLAELYSENPKPYLLWTEEDVPWICSDPPAPPQYLRIATAELLGRPERADWKKCDPILDRQLWLETAARLKPYFL